jgi:hypothetical protein
MAKLTNAVGEGTDKQADTNTLLAGILKELTKMSKNTEPAPNSVNI